MFRDTTAQNSMRPFRLGLLIQIWFWLPRTLAWLCVQPSHSKFFDFHLSSTPFEADFYRNPYDYDDSDPINYREGNLPPKSTRLVIGLNKYSHDTSLCAADADTGKVLFGISKERLSRRKHDAGNVATLVETCLETLDLTLENVDSVIMNNHHHRIRPIEESRNHMEWECGLQINGGTEDGYDDDYNLFTNVSHKHELSHHLAHAYSAAAQCPFAKGMIVVMDGMGETFRTMWNAQINNDPYYTSDLTIADNTWQCIPSDLRERCSGAYSRFDWREAESIYIFTKYDDDAGSISISPLFKRFVEEESPPALYNHGFENMKSVGAIYSRASSHIFGDWNACGKVMGLAPWIQHSWESSQPKKNGKRVAIKPTPIESPIMWGKLYADDNDSDKFQVNRTVLTGIPCIVRNDPDLFDQDGLRQRYDFDDGTDDDDNKPASSLGAATQSFAGVDQAQTATLTTAKRLPTKVALDAIAVAARVQSDLEAVIMDLVQHFKQQTGQANLCLVGGVALNSVLNGRLARELGFENTYVPPYPGDDGIAVGCCAFGLYGPLKGNFGKPNKTVKGGKQESRRRLWKKPLSPYLGPLYFEHDIQAAIESASPWLEVETLRNENLRLKSMVEEIAAGAVVAWFHGRSEFGPRALGHRSILADPRKKGLVRFINQYVKKRESFRPFAPSVLAEEAADWFDLGINANSNPNISPYMSMTAFVKSSKRALIPSVTHVDGSSRLQTVTADAAPLYHKLISMFRDKTGVPMVLNTSFNTLPGEPIVETPEEAIRSFLCSMGSIEMLVIGDYVVKRKTPNLSKLLGEVTKSGNIKVPPACPIRAGPASFQSSFSLEKGETDEESVITTTKVRMPARPMHFKNKGEWFELLDELEGELLSVCDGTVTFNDILAQYTATSAEQTERLSPQQLEEETQIIVQNIVQRLGRLFEHTLISW